MGNEEVKITLVIPARLASTRLPRKVLMDVGGKTLIQRVWEKCNLVKSHVAEVVVLTESQEVKEHVENFGGAAILTPDTIRNGTERVAFFSLQSDSTHFINCQGDDPTVSQSMLTRVSGYIKEHKPNLLTVVRSSTDPDEIDSFNAVKVVLDREKKTQYFSRFAIPFDRDLALCQSDALSPSYARWIHTGVYGYSKLSLSRYLQAEESFDEGTEKLEQLRFLSLNMKFDTIVDEFVSAPIDVLKDVERALARITLSGE